MMKRKSLLALLLALVLCLGCLGACGGNGNAQGANGGEPPAGDENQTSGGENGQVPDGEGQTPEGPSTDEGTDLPSLVDLSIPEGTGLGDRLANFTFTTFDGREYDLYETLAQKKMVLINIWATWCGPCQAEFPHMEQAYQEYKDDVEIFALSCEPTDSDDVLSDYVSQMEMTFPVGQDTPDLSTAFRVSAIPTSIVVDRFGVICLVTAGSQSGVDNFRRMFEPFLADDYTESVLLNGIPGPKSTVEAADPAKLAEALNVEGGTLTFENPDDAYSWPMKVMTKNDRTYVLSTNKAMGNTTALLRFPVTAAAGDVLALEYMFSTEEDYDYMTIRVNDALVRCLSGEQDWTEWAYEFKEAGDYTVTLSYVKDEATDGGSDLACFDNIRILSAGEGAALLAAQPVYPHGEANTLTPAGTDARRVLLNDPSGLVESNFPGAEVYIIPGASPEFTVTLAPGTDAEAARVTVFADSATQTDRISDKVDGDHYTLTATASASSTYSYVQLNPNPFESGITVLYFSNEEALNTFLIRNFSNEDGSLTASWKYADGAAPTTTAVKDGSEAIAADKALYYLVFVDQNGDPVPGVTANVCDDSACTPMVSDANGVIGFVYPAFAYHIQVIKVPDGYTYDTSAESYLAEDGGVTEFVVTRG